ncbi:Sulfatase-like hydrolase/transferase [Sulfidibacter corallicola]|uniref:Sulfatase-like hydrolase/transferase n=1 Tax=Sulfidibacter corallicola TaxID=2818388 RepID=A0A8A4TGG1_SULCO|nr:sulfatase-like hydrolase/transferase [Sulfidibacter corallicola]QTD49159.1 sulfatase-like hydrolase/transferase [Sulfidibacter corallicola]
MSFHGKRPNFLIITTDEQRFPPPYENPDAAAWRTANLKGQERIASRGMSFQRHYTGSTACAPSRTTIYTGQYPSLHGVSQTPGIGKSSFDQNMFWLKPDTVPTLGAWFRAAGYQTHWRGKWHLSYADIDVPGTQTALLSNDNNGESYPDRVELYREANRLEPYGFKGWIGPEPHGKSQANDGTNRDPGFADQSIRLLKELDQAYRANPDGQEPFLAVCSFVNPHDIVFSGHLLQNWFSGFQAALEAGSLPKVTPPPTANESLQTKPRCQQDYIYLYPRMYLPQATDETYRQFYYYLMGEVDKHIDSVYSCLESCSFFEDTIVVFTSDHGEMLGAHGGAHQKWYSAYDEILRVPFTISNPQLYATPKTCDTLTSHLDLLPTLLGLAGADTEALLRKLRISHSEAHPLVGRDLSSWIVDGNAPPDGVLYFMTDDNVENGSQMWNPITQQPYNSVVQPNHLETVIANIATPDGSSLWKYTRYFDNPRFYDTTVKKAPIVGAGNPDGVVTAEGIPPEFEAYNLSEDPLEEHNLMSPHCEKRISPEILGQLETLLNEQRKQKRLHPQTTNQDAGEETVAPWRD